MILLGGRALGGIATRALGGAAAHVFCGARVQQVAPESWPMDFGAWFPV